MGFYLRKSLRVGPLRFNLSKSGIGLSAGIKGFRIGTFAAANKQEKVMFRRGKPRPT